VLVKESEKLAWLGREPVFYVLAKNSLMICRNHEFFTSCAPARTWPPGLAPQEAFLSPEFPKLGRPLFEQVVGFFDRVFTLHGAEAAVLLVWDGEKRRAGVYVPDQTATVLKTWKGGKHAIGLEYFPPTNLGSHLVVYGDVHSHADMAAYCSYTDAEDERYRAGLHVVVGRVDKDPPEVHVEAVADGTRFALEKEDVLEGYRERRLAFPESWLEKVKVEVRSSVYASAAKTGKSWSSGDGWGASSTSRDGAKSWDSPSGKGGWQDKGAWEL
jgi:hypothetical protein